VSARASSVAVARQAQGNVLVRAAKRFMADHMTDHAAALTYYAMMSLFPGLLVVVTLLGLVGQQGLVTDATNYLLKHGVDKGTVDQIGTALKHMISTSSGALSITLVVSLLLALNGAAGAFGAAGRALNVVYRVEEDRGLVRRKMNDLLVALAVIVLLLVVLIAVFLGGQIAHDLFGKIGLGDTASKIWSIVRWPVAFVAASIAYALVYGLAPNREPRRVTWISVGAVLAIVLWLLLSAAFSFYVRNFSNYGAVYGTFASAIVLLLWLYLSANAFLYGAELNAERGDGNQSSTRSVSSGG
jgi:membrane protein